MISYALKRMGKMVSTRSLFASAMLLTAGCGGQSGQVARPAPRILVPATPSAPMPEQDKCLEVKEKIAQDLAYKRDICVGSAVRSLVMTGEKNGEYTEYKLQGSSILVLAEITTKEAREDYQKNCASGLVDRIACENVVTPCETKGLVAVITLCHPEI